MNTIPKSYSETFFQKYLSKIVKIEEKAHKCNKENSYKS